MNWMKNITICKHKKIGIVVPLKDQSKLWKKSCDNFDTALSKGEFSKGFFF